MLSCPERELLCSLARASVKDAIFSCLELWADWIWKLAFDEMTWGVFSTVFFAFLFRTRGELSSELLWMELLCLVTLVTLEELFFPEESEPLLPGLVDW